MLAIKQMDSMYLFKSCNKCAIEIAFICTASTGLNNNIKHCTVPPLKNRQCHLSMKLDIKLGLADIKQWNKSDKCSLVSCSVNTKQLLLL